MDAIKDTPMKTTTDNIGRRWRDMQEGTDSSDYPPLDNLIRRQHEVCRPDECPHRRPAALIQDISPTHLERLAVVEHEVRDLDRTLTLAREEGIREHTSAASKDELHILDKRIDNVHTRIDRDVTPEIKSLWATVNRRKPFYQRMQPIWIVISILVLISSLVVNILLLYGYYK